MEDLEAAYPLGYKYEYDASTDYHFVDYDALWQNGIKAFLKKAPFLLQKYKTLMRYKKLSAWFRYVLNLPSEVPASWVVDHRNEKRVEPVLSKAKRILKEAKPTYRGLSKRIMKEFENGSDAEDN